MQRQRFCCIIIWQCCMHPKLMHAGMEISGWRLSGFGLDSKASFTDLTDSSNSSRAGKLEAKDHHDARVMQTYASHLDTMDDGIGANCLCLFPPVFPGFIHIAWGVISSANWQKTEDNNTVPL